MSHALRSWSLIVAVLVVVAGCEKYDSPPQAALVNIEDGLLPDPAAPLTIAFHEPIVANSLQVKIVRYETDAEGELLPDDQLDVLYRRDPTSLFDEGGTGELDPTRKYFTISTTETFPIGPQLAVVIAPGLADDEGHVWNVPRILKFGFEFDCGEEQDPTNLPSAHYFLLADVSAPINTQLQLFVDMRVDAETGDWIGQFTNADRNPDIDCSQFGLDCAAEEVCRTLPEPACVLPSERAATVEEWRDFVSNDVPPTGYSFSGIGCARDVGEARFAFSNAPADVKVQSPPITVKGLAFNLEVSPDDDGKLSGGGTFTAQKVFLGDSESGSGAGTGVLVQIPVDEVPGGIPAPEGEPGAPPSE